MDVQSAEQTLFNFVILGKSGFPPKQFYNINYRPNSIKFLLRIFVTSTGAHFEVIFGGPKSESVQQIGISIHIVSPTRIQTFDLQVLSHLP